MKKILSLTLVLAMVMSMGITTAFAAGNWEGGTQVTYTATGAEEWTVTVPASLTPGNAGDVTAAGTWGSNRKLVVTADDSVKLTNSINSADYKDLAVTFADINLVGDNTQSVSETKQVSVAAMPADALFGTWTGCFNYDAEIVDVAPPTVDTSTMLMYSRYIDYYEEDVPVYTGVASYAPVYDEEEYPYAIMTQDVGTQEWLYIATDKPLDCWENGDGTMKLYSQEDIKGIYYRGFDVTFDATDMANIDLSHITGFEYQGAFSGTYNGETYYLVYNGDVYTSTVSRDSSDWELIAGEDAVAWTNYLTVRDDYLDIDILVPSEPTIIELN